MKKLILIFGILFLLVGGVNALEYNFIKDEGEITWLERFLATSGLFVITEQQCNDAVGECDGDDLVYKCIFHEETETQLAWCECHLKYDIECSGDECSLGQTKCNGDLYYTCDNGAWNFEGNVVGKCGYEEPACSSGQTKCDGTVYYECSNNQWLRKGQVIGKCGYDGSPVDPYLYEVSHEIIPSEKQIIGKYTLKNTGGDMTRYWILEQQVNYPGLGVQSAVALVQSTCDEDTPENVHKTFNMDAGEELIITLTSTVPDSKIDIGGYTEVNVIMTEYCGCIATECYKAPYKNGKYMGKYKVTEPTPPGPGEICCQIPIGFLPGNYRYDWLTLDDCRDNYAGSQVDKSKCEGIIPPIKKCEDCGKEIFGVCDAEECHSLGDCFFKQGAITGIDKGDCFSEQFDCTKILDKEQCIVSDNCKWKTEGLIGGKCISKDEEFDWCSLPTFPITDDCKQDVLIEYIGGLMILLLLMKS